MNLAEFRIHVGGINSIAPLHKLENELIRISNQNQTAESLEFIVEVFQGPTLDRLNLLPEDCEAALAILHDRIDLLSRNILSK